MDHDTRRGGEPTEPDSPWFRDHASCTIRPGCLLHRTISRGSE
jgi:hypothetical protein